jgi:hypothetical protein
MRQGGCNPARASRCVSSLASGRDLGREVAVVCGVGAGGWSRWRGILGSSGLALARGEYRGAGAAVPVAGDHLHLFLEVAGLTDLCQQFDAMPAHWWKAARLGALQEGQTQPHQLN